MEKLCAVLQSISAAIYKVQTYVLFLACAVLVILNFVQVVCRYCLGLSFAFSEELSLALFMFIILIGGNIAIKTDSEIRVDLIRFKNEKYNNAFGIVADTISLVILICLLAGSIALFQHVSRFPQSLASMPITYRELYTMLIVGFCLMLLDKVINLLKRFIKVRV